jgi:hypothetical protein
MITSCWNNFKIAQSGLVTSPVDVEKLTLTKEEFQNWVKRTSEFFRTGSNSHREWAAQVEPFDPKLAELYRRVADARDEVMRYVLSRAVQK